MLGTGGDPTVPTGEEACQLTMGMVANCAFDTSNDGFINVQDAVIVLNVRKITHASHQTSIAGGSSFICISVLLVAFL